MVRTIDGDQRRRDVADAAWRLILRAGLDGVSVRKVAAEAALSTGSVRHFFTTQAGLQRFAMQALAERVADRIAHAAKEPDLRARIRGMLRALLPLTDESAAEFTVWLHYVLRAVTEPELALVARATFDQVRELICHVLDGARAVGLVAADLDVPHAAAELNALIDGLTFDAITAPHLMSRADAAALLDTALDRLFTAGPKGAS
jgi:AcrR family transcriptional regulator